MPASLVLRTVYLPDKLDQKLRVRAFNNKMSKNELIRNYLEAAIVAETSPEGTSLNKKVASANILKLRDVLTKAVPKRSAATASAKKSALKVVGKTASKKAAKKVAIKKVATKKAFVKKVAAKKTAVKAAAKKATSNRT